MATPLAMAALAAVAALSPDLQGFVRSYSPEKNGAPQTEYFQGKGLSMAEPRTFSALVRVDDPQHRSCGFLSVNVDAPGGRGWCSLFCRNMERAPGEWLPGGAVQCWNFEGNPNLHEIFGWDFWRDNPKGAWHHAAIVVSGRAVRYYFDGRRVAECAMQTPFGRSDLLAEAVFNYDGHGATAERLVLDAALSDEAVAQYAADILAYRRYRDLLDDAEEGTAARGNTPP